MRAARGQASSCDLFASSRNLFAGKAGVHATGNLRRDPGTAPLAHVTPLGISGTLWMRDPAPASRGCSFLVHLAS